MECLRRPRKPNQARPKKFHCQEAPHVFVYFFSTVLSPIHLRIDVQLLVTCRCSRPPGQAAPVQAYSNFKPIQKSTRLPMWHVHIWVCPKLRHFFGEKTSKDTTIKTHARNRKGCKQVDAVWTPAVSFFLTSPQQHLVVFHLATAKKTAVRWKKTCCI